MSFKSQSKSLILFVPRTVEYWAYMIKDRIKYGKRKGPECGRFGCWVHVWVNTETGEEDPSHTSFRGAKALAPRLDCFTYQLKCGCSKNWWGTYRWYRWNCPNNCGGFNEA
jgi:hypothetical protein